MIFRFDLVYIHSRKVENSGSNDFIFVITLYLYILRSIHINENDSMAKLSDCIYVFGKIFKYTF